MLADTQEGTCCLFELLRVPVRREKHNNLLVRKARENSLDWSGEIAVARDHESRVEVVVEGVAEELNGDVHVGHFLFIILPCVPAAPTRTVFFEIVPLVDLSTHGDERINVVALASRIGVVEPVVPNSGGEVVGTDELLLLSEKILREAREIKPIVASAELASESEVQVEAVDVGNYAVQRPAPS